MLKLYNTLGRSKQDFKPITDKTVGMYLCGPTVYSNAHLGHMRKYTSDDILHRTLEYFGYEVKVVMNITDVGHLTGDNDEGEDKLEKGAKKIGLTVWEVAKQFEKQFFACTDALNIRRPDVVCRATEHIEDQINLVKKLQENGYTYQTKEGVYFDISKFPDYTKLSGQKLEDKQVAVREDVVSDKEKKHPADFALWLFTVGRFADHTMHWSSPWGEGFPGWHIECSAMSMKYLGETFDIHTGGIDHIPVHHTNEIAQSEAATGKKFVNYWVHNNFLKVEGEKMSKSLENLFTVEDVVKKGIDPLALRYLFLTAHYRDSLNFTWTSLESAQNALNKLRNIISEFKEGSARTVLSKEKQDKVDEFRNSFNSALEDDINVPQALAVMWQMLKSNIPSPDKYDLALTFDQVLGLKLSEVKEQKISPKILKLITEREELRKSGKFAEADKLREQIEAAGIAVQDKNAK